MTHNAKTKYGSENPWYWSKETTWGHGFKKHGQGKKIEAKLRSETLTKGPQGQWLNNELASICSIIEPFGQ